MDKQWGPIVQHRELYPISWDGTRWGMIWKKECVCVYKYIYDWVTLLHSRNWHNVVNHLYFNFKNIKNSKTTTCTKFLLKTGFCSLPSPWLRISVKPRGNFFSTITWDQSYIQTSLSTAYMYVIFFFKVMIKPAHFHSIALLKSLKLNCEMDQQVLATKLCMEFWPVPKQKLGIWVCQLWKLELKWSELWGQHWALPKLFEMGR